MVRFGSMNKAADELGIAPSSVTQHIRNIEDFVGGDLFNRTANSISLNARGEAYAQKITAAFDTIQEATSAVSLKIDSSPIRISCVPTFATDWLAEQLAALRQEFPKTEIRCDFSPTLADFEADEIDIAIRFGTGVYSGTHTELLHTDALAPICTPETAAQIHQIEDIRHLIRLDTDESAPDGGSLWAYWADQIGGDDWSEHFEAQTHWTVHSSAFSMQVLRAMPCVAMLERSVVQPYLDNGTLIAPFEMWVQSAYGYHIVTSKRRVLQPAAKRLVSLIRKASKARFSH